MKFKFKINETVIQVALVAFNFIFSILSIALIALGVVYVDSLQLPKHYVALEFLELPTLLIVLGSLSFLASIGGCYCARKDNQRLMKFFIIFLSFLLALEFAIALITFLNLKESVPSKVRDIMRAQLLSEEFADRNEVYKLEEFYDCCGLDGAKDYLNEGFRPETCCKNECSICTEEFINATNIGDKRGCVITVVENIRKVAIEIASYSTVCACLRVLEIFCLILMSIKE